MQSEIPRVVLLVIDQLAGHWVPGAATVQSTGLPPPNIMDYHKHGLIPNISECINNGLWTLRPMSQGKCMTPYGMRYLASGRYDSHQVVLEDEWCCHPYADGDYRTICEWIDRNRPDIKVATFGSGCWLAPGYWHTTQHCVPLPGYYPDEKELTEYVFPYARANPDWRFLMIYLPEHDLTAKPYGLPVSVPDPETPVSDKHHHLVDHVDRHVGMLIDFLMATGAWDDVLMVITSDHAYHYGCDAMSGSFRPHDGPRTSTELCWDHVWPWDCKAWDFSSNRPISRGWSDCCRRVTQIVTGRALPLAMRGTTREHGDICDATATVAGALGIPFNCAGESIVSL
jgi:hypothetical protein